MKLKNLSKGQKVAAIFSFVVVAFLVLLLLTEAIVRVRHYFKHGSFWGIEKTYYVDKKTNLRVPRPSITIGPVKINSFGFRSPEITKEKSQNTSRWAFLGASTTYCAEVSSNANTWPDILINKLKLDFKSRPIDYLNAAVPGYAVNTSKQNLYHRVRQFNPDVILIYHSTNDLTYNTHQIALSRGIIQQRADQGMSPLAKYSLFLYLIEKNLRIMFRLEQAQAKVEKLGLKKSDLREPFYSDLKSLVKASKLAAKTVIMPTFTHHLRRKQSFEKRKEAAITNLYYMPHLSIEEMLLGYETYNEIIKEIAEEEDIILVDGEYEIDGTKEMFVDSVHFTDRGSKSMADRMYKRLRKDQRIVKILSK